MFRRNIFHIKRLTIKIVFAAFCLLSVLIYIHSEALPAEMMSSKEFFKRGLANYEARDYKSAIENFQEAIFLDPANQQAKDYLEKARKKILEEGKSKKESERKEILKKADTITAERKKKVQENYERGLERYKGGEFLRANEAFNAVLEIEPEHKEAKKHLELIGKKLEEIVNTGKFKTINQLYYAQGAIFYISGDWGKAISQWENAVKIDKSNEELSEFIKIAKKRKQGEEALALEKAEALYRDVLAHYDEKEVNEVIKQLEEVIKLNPEHKEAREYLNRVREKLAAETTPSEECFQQGLADYQTGDYKSAMENFSEALFLDPDNKQAKDYLERAGKKFLEEVGAKREFERREILRKAQTMIAEREKKIKENCERGIKHYRSGEFLTANEAFNAVLEVEPEHKEAKKYLELIKKRLQDIVNKGEFKSVNELYYAQGAIFYISGDWDKAIAQWENAIKIDPSNKELSGFMEIARKRRQEEEAVEKAEVLYRDGLAQYNKGEINETIKQLEEVIKFNPQHRKAQELLAKVREKATDVKKEERERMLRETVDKRYFQGIDYYAEGQFNKAIKEWQEVLKIDPTHSGAKEYLKKARDKIARANSREKIREDKARNAKEEKIEVYYRQGINYYLAGEFKAAIGQWEEVLKMDPSHNDATGYIAKAKERLKISGEGMGYSDYKEEIEEYVKELEKTGTTDEEKDELIAIHYQDGLVAYAQGDLSQAMKEWQIVLKLDPEHKKARRAIIKLQAEMERRKGQK